MLTATMIQAQSLQAGDAVIINDRAVTHYSDNYRTTACGPDSVLYALQKATGLQTISVNSATSAQALSQYFDCPQAITVNGASFYAYKADATGGITMNAIVELYLAGADSLPTGAPLASATVLIDTTFGGGLLSVLIKHASFTPVTMSQPYCMVVSNPTPTNMVSVVSDYTAVPADGAGEWLAGADLFGTWTHSYDLNVGGITFDADLLVEPHVEYDLTAGFSQSPSCIGNSGTGTFTNTSSPIVGNRMYSVAAFLGIEAVQYTWNFGDGSASVNAIDTSHTYGGAAPWTVTLVDTLFGWTSTCTDFVAQSTGQPAVSGFTSVESGFTSTFTSTSIGDPWLSHLWDFGDGNTDTVPNPVHTYGAPGTYTVCLLTFNSCGADTLCQAITIANPAPSNDTCGGALPISCGDVLSGSNLTATDNDAPASCTSSGNGVWYTFTGDGSIVTLTTCSPNTDFDTEIIVVSGDCNNQVCETFNDDDFGCANGTLLSTVTFTSTAGVDYFVHVGSYFAANGLGNFELSMFCSQPCSLDGLTAGAQGACDGITDTYTQDVVVTYSSAPATGTLDLNGQSFAITGSPQTVTLVGLTADGLDVDVTASFSADGSCPLTALALFTAPASCLGSCDGKADFSGLPATVCANDGPYTLTPLYIGGTYSLPDGNPAPYITNDGNAASFTADSLPLAIPDNITPGLNANVFVSGVDPSATLGSICLDITHSWDGDLTVRLMNPSGTSVDLLQRPGVPATSFGCSGDTIRVTIVPGTGNDMENACVTGGAYGLLGEFTAHNGQDIASFTGDPNGLWSVSVIDSASGDVGTLENFTLNFGTPGEFNAVGLSSGTYDFVHTYSTCEACVDIDTFSVTVGNVPTAAFTQSAADLVVDFTDASTGTVDNHFWDFGDGNTSTMMNPQHTYAAPGTYTVCLTVTNSCGSDSSCATVTVTCPAPNSDFSEVSNNLVVDFTDMSTGTIDNHLWDFGDGNTSTMMNPQHTFAAPGTYTVCLTVTNSCGSDSSCATVTVTCPPPVSDWTSSSNNLVVDFTDASTGTVDNHFWDFGDGNTSTMMNPQHTYAADGTYTVCLTVSNSCGADSSCGSVTVMDVVTLPNDSCIDAITINCGDVLSGTTIGATDDVSPDFCAEFGDSGPGVWYTTVGDGSAMTFSTCSSNTDFDTEITVMSGDCNNLVCVGSNDDGNCPTGALLSDFTFNSQVGVTYYIYVGSYFSGAVGGNFDLTMTCSVPLVGDNVCDPISLSMGLNGPYDNTAATVEPGEPYAGIGSGANTCQSQDGWCSFENGLDNTMWFTFVAPPSGNMVVHTDGSDHDTQIAVWTVDSCQNLLTGGETLIAANDDNPDYVLTQFSSVLFLCGLTPGATYYLQSDGYNGDAGTALTITLSETTLTAAYTSTSTGLTADFTDASTSSTIITSHFWDFGDGNTSTDMNPSNTYAADGTYLVCLTVTDTLGCTATTCDTVTVTDIPTSIFEAVDRGMTVYPNPSNGRFTVSFTGVDAEVQMEVTDIAGRLIYSETETLTNGFNKEIDLDAANGTYLLQIKTAEGVVSRRLQIH